MSPALALFRLPLSQPDTGATAVFVDEFDAGCLECPTYRQIVGRCH